MSSATNLADPPKRRWYQYSLRSLFVFMTVAGCGLGWLGVKVRDARRQKEAINAIESVGGEVNFDHEYDGQGNHVPDADIPGPAWLRSLIGDDFFRTVCRVSLVGSSKPSLATLEQMEKFPQLKTLLLIDEQLTDSGLENLRGLTRLKVLCLNCTLLTDAGLEHLKGMKRLEYLRLRDTWVTDAGIENLQRALPNCKISKER